jgi:hypothetical protein
MRRIPAGGRWLVLVPLLALLPAPVAKGQSIPAGFRAHVAAVRNGQVDWGHGRIIAHGIAKARGTSPREHFMAERAAGLIAARNAMAIGLGIRIDRHGRFEDIEHGMVRLNGVLRDFSTTPVRWMPNLNPPLCEVRVEVPVWGVKGVAATMLTLSRTRSTIDHPRPVALAMPDGSPPAEFVIVDARRIDIEPSLFPALISNDHLTLYDVNTPVDRSGQSRPIARFVETDQTYDELSDGRSGSNARRVVARAVSVDRRHRTEIVMAGADVERIAFDPAASGALRDGRVLIVVKPAADPARDADTDDATPVIRHAE